MQSPKNMGNLGTTFLRKVFNSEDGLTRISRVYVVKEKCTIEGYETSSNI